MKQTEIGGRYIRHGFWLLLLGFLMSFGIVLHYVVGARWDTGAEFLKNATLWYGCPWTLSTAVVIGGALDMIAIGTVYSLFGKMQGDERVGGSEAIALTLCKLSLGAIFLSGYVGYFVVDRIWPGFYYVPIKDGKNVWLFMQLACMVMHGAGIFLAFNGIRRISRAMA